VIDLSWPMWCRELNGDEGWHRCISVLGFSHPAPYHVGVKAVGFYPVVIGSGARALPIALCEPEDTDLPLGGYQPEQMRVFPFSLAEPSAVSLHDGERLLQPPAAVLECDAPHWFDNGGYRLWDDEGPLTSFMQRIMDEFQLVRRSVERTRMLVQVLKQSGVLRRIPLYHNGVMQRVYTVDPLALEQQYEWFDQHERGLSAIMLADALQVSQTHLTCHDGIWMMPSQYEQCRRRGDAR
jgi:hypothetical protein